mmetsp:Transcript_53211/g.154934  ORF Transcript_53211/g.154934 Transcript_53211/m.154934 type:complete len:206 (+) Transcript_53211:1587-2204(+)
MLVDRCLVCVLETVATTSSTSLLSRVLWMALTSSLRSGSTCIGSCFQQMRRTNMSKSTRTTWLLLFVLFVRKKAGGLASSRSVSSLWLKLAPMEPSSPMILSALSRASSLECRLSRERMRSRALRDPGPSFSTFRKRRFCLLIWFVSSSMSSWSRSSRPASSSSGSIMVMPDVLLAPSFTAGWYSSELSEFPNSDASAGCSSVGA